MSENNFITYHTSVPYVIKGENGRDEHPFNFNVYIRLYENGDVHCIETTDEIDDTTDITKRYNLGGKYSVSHDDTVHVELRRARPPEVKKLETLDDAENNNENPADAKVSTFTQGYIRVTFNKTTMSVVDSSYGPEEIPRYFETTQNLPNYLPSFEDLSGFRMSDEWVTFYELTEEEQQPWNSYDEPTEVELHNHLRLFKDGRAQVYMSSLSRAEDNRAFTEVHAEGTWHYQAESSFYIIELERKNGFASRISWTDGMVLPKYLAILKGQVLHLFSEKDGNVSGSVYPHSMSCEHKPFEWLTQYPDGLPMPAFKEE